MLKFAGGALAKPVRAAGSARSEYRCRVAGFEFQETHVPNEGEFDISSINLRFVWISGLRGGLHWPPCALPIRSAVRQLPGSTGRSRGDG